MLNQFSEIKTTSNNLRLLATIFFLALIFLMLIILINIIPSAEIVLQVNREPYLDELQLKLDTSLQKNLYNLEMIPASILKLDKINRNQYILIDGLIDKQKNLALVFKYKDLNNFLNQKLSLLKPISKKSIEGKIQIVSYEVKNFDISNGWALVKLLVKTEVIPNFNSQFLDEKLVNQLGSAAVGYLKILPNVQDVKINYWPSFLSRLPSLNWRIKIKVIPL